MDQHPLSLICVCFFPLNSSKNIFLFEVHACTMYVFEQICCILVSAEGGWPKRLIPKICFAFYLKSVDINADIKV